MSPTVAVTRVYLPLRALLLPSTRIHCASFTPLLSAISSIVSCCITTVPLLFYDCFLDHIHQAPAFGFADGFALGNFHLIAQTGEIFWVMHQKPRPPAPIFAIFPMAH